jgi:hypothetical protein
VKTHQKVVWHRWSVTKLASITFLSLALSYWIDYLGFITEGKLATMLITPSLGVPNWSVIYIINIAPSISNTTGLSFALERIGPLAAIIITVFYLLVLYLSA